MLWEFDRTPHPDDSPDAPGVRERARLDELAAAYHAFVGHELANQLVPLQAFAALIGESLAPDDPARELLRGLERTAAGLARPARRLADLGRLLAGAAFGPPLSIADAIREAAAEAACVAPAGSARIEVADVPGRVCLARKPFHAALVEILRNAAASGGGGAVRVEASASLEDGCLTVIIRDDGVGISHREPAKLFEPFAAGRRPGATGPGLGIFAVCQLVSRWGGRLTLSSASPRGTTATLFVPAADRWREP